MKSTLKPNSAYEDWINRKWRPALAVQYIIVCIFDFVIAPSATFIFYYYTQGTYAQWQPITLSATGLYHLSMGAILGVAAWQRGEEKKLRFRRDEYYDNEPREQYFDRAEYRSSRLHNPDAEDGRFPE